MTPGKPDKIIYAALFQAPLSRRDFLKQLAGVCVASSSVVTPALSSAATPPEAIVQKLRGRVVIARRKDVYVDAVQVSAAVIRQMLRDGICRLVGTANLKAAWLALFTPDDIIGIKVNAMGGRSICSHPELVYAIADSLIEAGIAPYNIIIWDRLSQELQRAGYTIQRGGKTVQCLGTDTEYETEPETSGSIGSCFSRILSRQCTALISVPVLKDHDLCGVSLHLKNFYGAIHNPNKYHDNGCDPYIADLNAHPPIKNKIRLVICDGMRGQYHGGPGFKPQWSWQYQGLIFSCDPVAADKIGAEIIDEQRKANGLPSLKDAGRYPRHIDTAGLRNLGINDLNKIDSIYI